MLLMVCKDSVLKLLRDQTKSHRRSATHWLLLNAVLDIFSSSVIPEQGAVDHTYKNHCMVLSVQKQGFPNYSKDTFQAEEKNVKGGLFPLSAELMICHSIIIRPCNQKLRHEL